MEKNVVQQNVYRPILKLKLRNNGNNRFKSLNGFKSLKKHSIDHVLPSGVGWEASVAKRIIQR